MLGWGLGWGWGWVGGYLFHGVDGISVNVSGPDFIIARSVIRYLGGPSQTLQAMIQGDNNNTAMSLVHGLTQL